MIWTGRLSFIQSLHQTAVISVLNSVSSPNRSYLSLECSCFYLQSFGFSTNVRSCFVKFDSVGFCLLVISPKDDIDWIQIDVSCLRLHLKHNLDLHFDPHTQEMCIKPLVIRQKGESQNGCFNKTKHTKFCEERIFLTLWYTDTYFIS